MLTIVLPILFTAGQTAKEAPGFPLGLADIEPGWKRKTVQLMICIFSPLTIALLRLQYQLVLKKKERVQELQNKNLIGEFNRLNRLATQMDLQRKKAIKIDITFEVAYQIFINLILVLLSKSDTRTTSSMESLFNQEGKDEFVGISNLTIFILSTVVSFLSFINLFITAHASNWNWKSKLAVGFYGVLCLLLRLLAMITFFIPSLGLMNTLRHYQTDRVAFGAPTTRYQSINDTLYFGNAPPVQWKDISHVNYTDRANPTPPPYSLYTGLDSKSYFLIFVVLWSLQVFLIWLKNFRRSKIFRTLSGFDQVMHSWQSVICPAPSVDWSVGQGGCKEHFDRMKTIENEVVETAMINSVFQGFHILPLVYLGKSSIRIKVIMHAHMRLQEFVFNHTVNVRNFAHSHKCTLHICGHRKMCLK